jgi:hypothetical protein
MLEFDFINVGAGRTDPSERHRLQSPQLNDDGFQLRQLLARELGQLRALELLLRPAY